MRTMFGLKDQSFRLLSACHRHRHRIQFCALIPPLTSLNHSIASSRFDEAPPKPRRLHQQPRFRSEKKCHGWLQVRYKSTLAGDDEENDEFGSNSLNPPPSVKDHTHPNVPTSNASNDTKISIPTAETAQLHQRVWTAGDDAPSREMWSERVVDKEDEASLLFQIGQQERSGGRMRSRQQGVLHEDPVMDMRLLTQNYTVSSLASALRDREDALQQAAVMAEEGGDTDLTQLRQFLKMFHPRYVLERRESKHPDLTKKLDEYSLEWLRKMLMRMPRAVVSAHTKRAAVVLPLCTVQGVPCLLLEKRAQNLRAHPDEVCLPGGMYCEIHDKTVVATSLREMKEEIEGLHDDNIQVLGVFRCNWGEVHHLVGVAVTPVVCFLGELPDNLQPNPDEVSQLFTVSLKSLMDSKMWIHREGLAPQFLGGPHPIWGLTGYILDRFRRDVLT